MATDPRHKSRPLLEGPDRAVARSMMKAIGLDVELTDAQLQERLAAWRARPPRYTSGVLAKYARLVADASRGAVTDAAAP